MGAISKKNYATKTLTGAKGIIGGSWSQWSEILAEVSGNWWVCEVPSSVCEWHVRNFCIAPVGTVAGGNGNLHKGNSVQANVTWIYQPPK